LCLCGQRFKLGLFIYSLVEVIGLLLAASVSFTPAQPSPTVLPSPIGSPTTKPSPASTADSGTWSQKFWERYQRRSR
jgi:hypothetical protein